MPQEVCPPVPESTSGSMLKHIHFRAKVPRFACHVWKPPPLVIAQFILWCHMSIFNSSTFHAISDVTIHFTKHVVQNLFMVTGMG